jgi:hypothetical protein
MKKTKHTTLKETFLVRMLRMWKYNCRYIFKYGTGPVQYISLNIHQTGKHFINRNCRGCERLLHPIEDEIVSMLKSHANKVLWGMYVWFPAFSAFS